MLDVDDGGWFDVLVIGKPIGCFSENSKKKTKIVYFVKKLHEKLIEKFVGSYFYL